MILSYWCDSLLSMLCNLLAVHMHRLRLFHNFYEWRIKSDANYTDFISKLLIFSLTAAYYFTTYFFHILLYLKKCDLFEWSVDEIYQWLPVFNPSHVWHVYTYFMQMLKPKINNIIFWRYQFYFIVGIVVFNYYCNPKWMVKVITEFLEFFFIHQFRSNTRFLKVWRTKLHC